MYMDETTRLAYLEAMGIQAWVRRDNAVVQTTAVAPSVESLAPLDSSLPDWASLERRVAVCTLCELHKGRTKTVFGVGDRQADWMIIGEGPGYEEDRQGEPFVGPAGKLLNEMLRAIGLQRDNVYIANIVKCRPPNNRDPRAEEAMQCEQYLSAQIALVRPKIILAVGRIAAQNLLKTQLAIGELRGKPFTYSDGAIPLVVTYHPAYLLRSPLEKRKAWQDLQTAMAIYRSAANS